MKMALLLALLYSQLSHADIVQCNGNCNESCTDIEKLSLHSMALTEQNYLQLFFPKEKITDAKSYMNSISTLHTELINFRKNLSNQCLDKICAEESVKNPVLKLASGISLETTSPLCDFPKSNRNYSSNSSFVFMRGRAGTIAQITYSKSDNNLLIMIKSHSKNCKDDVSGTFNNNFVASLNGIAIVPFDSTTKVSNNPSGIQLIKNKKSVPYPVQTDSSIINFNLGENFNVKVDSQSNQIVSENILTDKCSGTIGHGVDRKGNKTSRVVLNANSVNKNGLRSIGTESVTAIEAASSKVPW